MKRITLVNIIFGSLTLFVLWLLLVSYNNVNKTGGTNIDTVLIHKNYTVLYDRLNNTPKKVDWWLTRDEVDCNVKLKRKDIFTSDPYLGSDVNMNDVYKHSGYDRGHMCPAADNKCDSTNLSECFYFSNITPQTHTVNAGVWLKTETKARNLAIEFDSVHVYCGTYGNRGIIGNVIIPEKFWKIIYVKSINTYYAYIVNNVNYIQKNYEVSVSDVESLTGFKFN